MFAYQRDFLQFAHTVGALRFGEFVLKSGRSSPYFFNAGLFNTGKQLAQLGTYYAQAIVHAGLEFDVLFGPAYKGIPLAAATAMALANDCGRDVGYAFNRKEPKDHGEGGEWIGAPARGRVLMIDDVLSAGISTRAADAFIRAHGAVPIGLLIALDRQERGLDTRLAATAIEEDLGIPVLAIARFTELVDYLANTAGNELNMVRLRTYRAHYGG